MLSQWGTIYNQSFHFLPVGSGITMTCSPSSTKFLLKCNFFEFKIICIVLPKIKNMTKKSGANFVRTTDSSIEKC